MNHTLTGTEDTIERHGPPAKKGCGCLINSLIGIGVFVVASVAAVWLIIMHSSLPLRFVTNLIEEGGAASNLKITGVSGSLSSGLSFKNVQWNDGRITDMRFRYSGIMDVIRRKQLIIHEMHVGSATLDTTFFTESPEEPEAEPAGEPSTHEESGDFPLKLVRIDRVSLNKIIIKNATTGNTITIPKIEWTGFKAEKEKPVELGNLVADSDHLVIKTTNPPASDYQKRVEITLLPKLDARILKPIRIDAYLGQKDRKSFSDIKAFDATVHFTQSADGNQHIRAEGANLAEFIDAPLPDKLDLDISIAKTETADSILTIRSGSFLLGTHIFTIQPTTVTGPEKPPETTSFLVALSRAGNTELRFEIPITETEEPEQSHTPILTSTPAMQPEDLMALLFHDRKFSDLPPPDQEKLRKHMTWFSFSK